MQRNDLLVIRENWSRIANIELVIHRSIRYADWVRHIEQHGMSVQLMFLHERKIRHFYFTRKEERGDWPLLYLQLTGPSCEHLAEKDMRKTCLIINVHVALKASEEVQETNATLRRLADNAQNLFFNIPNNSEEVAIEESKETKDQAAEDNEEQRRESQTNQANHQAECSAIAVDNVEQVALNNLQKPPKKDLPEGFITRNNLNSTQETSLEFQSESQRQQLLNKSNKNFNNFMEKVRAERAVKKARKSNQKALTMGNFLRSTKRDMNDLKLKMRILSKEIAYHTKKIV